MGILFMFNGTYPDGMAMSKRLHLYGKALLENGISPHIVFPVNTNSKRSGCHEGIHYSSFKSPMVSRRFILQLINDLYAAFYFAGHGYRLAKKYNVFFVSGFGWFAGFLLTLAIHLRNARIIFEVNENPYSPEGGRLDPVWVRKVRRQLMLNLTFKFTDGFIVISEKLEKLINGIRKKSAYVLKVPILIDDAYKVITNRFAEDQPYILHAGALSETKDGMIAVFEAFAKACKQTAIPLKFILTIKVMQPQLMRKIELIIKNNDLGGRVIFKGLLSEKELDELRASCAMAIVNKPSNWQNDYNFPTKLGELLSAGVPVIVSSTGEMCKYLKDEETALFVPADDSDAIACKILQILNNPDLASNIRHNGKELAKNSFHYKNHSRKLAEFFNEIAP